MDLNQYQMEIVRFTESNDVFLTDVTNFGLELLNEIAASYSKIKTLYKNAGLNKILQHCEITKPVLHSENAL